MSNFTTGFEVKEKTIGDCTYKAQPLGFNDGNRVLTRVLNLAGPGLSQGVAGGKMGLGARVLAAVLTNITDDQIAIVTSAFAKSTTVRLPDGKEPRLSDVMNTHFVGKRYAQFPMWLAFAFEVTFGDFFAVIGPLLSPDEATAADSESPTDATGASGAS